MAEFVFKNGKMMSAEKIAEVINVNLPPSNGRLQADSDCLKHGNIAIVFLHPKTIPPCIIISDNPEYHDYVKAAHQAEALEYYDSP